MYGKSVNWSSCESMVHCYVVLFHCWLIFVFCEPCMMFYRLISSNSRWLTKTSQSLKLHLNSSDRNELMHNRFFTSLAVIFKTLIITIKYIMWKIRKMYILLSLKSSPKHTVWINGFHQILGLSAWVSLRFGSFLIYLKTDVIIIWEQYFATTNWLDPDPPYSQTNGILTGKCMSGFCTTSV